MLHHMCAPRVASSRRLVAPCLPWLQSLNSKSILFRYNMSAFLGTEINLCQEKKKKNLEKKKKKKKKKKS